MATFSRVFIETRFKNAMAEAGLPTGEPYNADGSRNVGVYYLDHRPIYGGWMIVRASEGGGQSTPFGHTRYKAKDFVNVLGVIRDTAYILRVKHDISIA